MPEDIISSVEAAAQGKPKVGGLRIRRIALWLETVDEEVTSKKTVFVAGEVDFEFFKTKTRQEDLESSTFSFPKPKSAEECLGSMLLAWFEFTGDLADNWKEDLAAGRPVPYKDESLDRPVFRLLDRSGETTFVKPWNEVSVTCINGWLRAAAAQAGYNLPNCRRTVIERQPRKLSQASTILEQRAFSGSPNHRISASTTQACQSTTLEDALLWIDKLGSSMRRSDGLDCPKCGNVSKDQDTYLKHLKRVHGEKDSWPCRDSLRALPHKCTKKFRSKDAERNHYRYKHASECECPVCHGVLLTQDSLNRHLQESHPGWTADASSTSLMMADASSDRDPLIAVTDTTVPGTRKHVKTFVCTTCSKVTATQTGMENHLALHRDEQAVAAERL
ncbi:hypothetical protein HDU87_000994 [Geranomyces variabilis]|uniref:C2H2-type domain-containing protein n=1 Tax=Geranomyces variabilis TaxID=109894 RepID=A0AAD5XLH1_9FUNG|nr:hypothetical protein HDU87_000994 [Geranomyces variabilis]